MTTFLIIAIALFAVFIALITWVSWNYYKRQYSGKTWKIWGFSISYWEGIVTISCGLTILTIFILQWTNILPL